MKRTLSQTLVLFSLFLTAFAHAVTDPPELPANFTITERWVSLMPTFDLQAGKRNLGTVSKKIFALTPTYEYYDGGRRLQATARRALFSWGVRIDIYDANHAKIGTIQEQILRSLLKVRTYYLIYDADGKQVAESEKVDWLATEFTLRDRRGYQIARVKRPFWRWREKWAVTINDSKTVDPRILVMIGVYKSDADQERRQSNN